MARIYSKITDPNQQEEYFLRASKKLELKDNIEYECWSTIFYNLDFIYFKRDITIVATESLQ